MTARAGTESAAKLAELGSILAMVVKSATGNEAGGNWPRVWMAHASVEKEAHCESYNVLIKDVISILTSFQHTTQSGSAKHRFRHSSKLADASPLGTTMPGVAKEPRPSDGSAMTIKHALMSLQLQAHDNLGHTRNSPS